MKINNKKYKFLSLVLALSIVSPTIVNASPTVTKEETVYVILNNDGQVDEKLSSIWIHSDSDLDKVVDKSTLTDIVNIKDDTMPSKEDDKLIWNVTGSDIYYQGTPNKDLPIETTIKYFLDNEEVDPNSILGKSGKLKIEIDIKNTHKQSVNLKNNGTKELYTPYIVATAVDLPTDKFSNVDINTGKLISDGSRQIVSHISLPGIQESLGIEKDLKSIEDKLEITADVEDFEMESIMFVVTSQFPDIEDIDSAKDIDQLVDGLEKIEDASDKLLEATQKLADGQKELGAGIEKLVDGTNKLQIGSNDLLSGSNQLKEGINSAHTGSQQINQGVNKLSSSANELGAGFSKLGDGAVEFSGKAVEFSKASVAVADGLSSIPENSNALKAGMDDIINSTKAIENGQQSLTAGLDKSLTGLQQIKAGKDKESKVIDLLLKGVDGLDTIANAFDKIPGTDGLTSKLKGILTEQRAALEGIKNSSNELLAALNNLEQGLAEAKEASNQLSQGTKSLNDGQMKLSNGLGELANGTLALKDASSQLSQASLGLEQGANTINESAKTAQSGAKMFTNGSQELAGATNELSNGLGQLKNGSVELNEGISRLGQGAKELASGGQELAKGNKQLVDGTEELNKGMKQFNEEGIDKISKELDSSNLNIADIIDRKDELVKLSKDNQSFSGISDDMDGTLKFVMKTESIKKDESEEESPDNSDDSIEENSKEDNKEVATTDENKGFIKWIKGIFS